MAALTAPGTRELEKAAVVKLLSDEGASAGAKYQEVFVGRPGLAALLRYELAMGLAAPASGAAGYLLRKWTYGRLCGRVGPGVLWGRNVILRHPGAIRLGARVVIDDNCLLDARGGGPEGIGIGDDVLIARDTLIQAKTSWIAVGDRCVISSQCQLSSAGGISLGRAVLVAGQCYLGGGRYHTEDPTTPMMDQGLYTKGPLVIEDDVWIGAGVVVQDGVRIGRGSVVGSGAVVTRDVPAFAVVAGVPARLLRWREGRAGGPDA
jgi:acetyltransferase-like isoleucine patch superfamily enzyme